MTIQETLDERRQTHGDFSTQGSFSQRLKFITRVQAEACKGDYLEALDSVQREALEMILHKIARIVCGDPNNVDTWHDIAGYATLVENDLKGLDDEGLPKGGTERKDY